MSLELQINNDIKNAMLAKEKVRLTALRAIKAAILLAKTAEGASHELSDADVLRIIQKLVKQRRESAEIYKQNGREDLAGNELAELSFMEPYLPKTLSGEELEAALRQIISQTGASGPSDMGKVMGVATKQLAGQADGRQISETVKKLLS
ncbi:MAG: GatB/YqeY domain-containing protein [Bacteroidales bacterium]|nr:GatB/YqeY domain-containing protein [Bacteroidales bacterium]